MKEISLDEAERRNLIKDERLGPEPVPFGFLNKEPLEFKAQIQDGDELWQFMSPDDSWAEMCGRAGICIVKRDGEIGASIVTMGN
jgi:hypothetical protein